MSEVFDSGRFAGYARKIYRENGRKYVTYMLVVVGVQLLWTVACTLTELTVHMVPFMLFNLAAPLMGVVMVMSEMRPFRNRLLSPVACTIPVSMFERYLMAWINSVVVFSVFFLVSYAVVSLLGAFAFRLGDLKDYWWMDGYYMKVPVFDSLLSLFVLFNAIALFSGGTNLRYHLVSFAATAVIVCGLLSLYVCYMSGQGFGPDVLVANLAFLAQPAGVVTELETGPLFLITAVVLWLAGYFKFKGRQVR